MKRIINKDLLKSFQGQPCTVCKTVIGTSAHHVKTKGSGGHDVESNLMTLCFYHHRAVHDKGLTHFANTYLSARNWLIEKGWEFSPELERWFFNNNNLN